MVLSLILGLATTTLRLRNTKLIQMKGHYLKGQKLAMGLEQTCPKSGWILDIPLVSQCVIFGPQAQTE